MLAGISMAWLAYLLPFTWLAAFLLWRRFTASEVKLNDRDITANGAADDLRKGYHQRRGNVRALVAGGLVLVAGLPLAPRGRLPYLLASVGLLALLAGYFARYFTPLLNLARIAAGRTDLSEFYASPDSASWPDAAAWKEARHGNNLAKYVQQSYANDYLRRMLTRTWWACRSISLVLFLATCYLIIILR
ncbi:hypothetical protein QMK33_19655 [Hymenobacter sp. H14-R3]|uniref:hypothetical protein n=1 Tax=Hymenobacter sp. H14-R3 TaxID=3046308 RepID=UPI0024BB83C4|nr:hypothetical protein [Hymenobacter sp. H14-R3]MDJ0367370.1 hypothetical protein [Hymenobacter sp. H14-R3]